MILQGERYVVAEMFGDGEPAAKISKYSGDCRQKKLKKKFGVI